VSQLVNLHVLELYVWQSPPYLQPFACLSHTLVHDNLPNLCTLVFGVYIQQHFQSHLFTPVERTDESICRSNDPLISKDCPLISSKLENHLLFLFQSHQTLREMELKISEVWMISESSIHHELSDFAEQFSLQVTILKESPDVHIDWISGMV
jgi:hypothetical protein